MRFGFANSQTMSSLPTAAGRLGMRLLGRTCEMSDRRPCSEMHCKSFNKADGARPAKDFTLSW
jgi:hypothetical protein